MLRYFKDSAQCSISRKSHQGLGTFIVHASAFVIICLGSYENVLAQVIDPPMRQF